MWPVLNAWFGHRPHAYLSPRALWPWRTMSAQKSRDAETQVRLQQPQGHQLDSSFLSTLVLMWWNRGTSLFIIRLGGSVVTYELVTWPCLLVTWQAPDLLSQSEGSSGFWLSSRPGVFSSLPSWTSTGQDVYQSIVYLFILLYFYQLPTTTTRFYHVKYVSIFLYYNFPHCITPNTSSGWRNLLCYSIKTSIVCSFSIV